VTFPAFGPQLDHASASTAIKLTDPFGEPAVCERVFSSAKETITARRSRISPDLMEGLQMLKYSIRKGRHLNFTAGTSWEAEIMEMDQDAKSLQQVPEDVPSYSDTLYKSAQNMYVVN
jgi:hypothetical protein